METHQDFGSLIEFCKGTQAKQLAGKERQSPALWEGLALTMIAGLSDAHHDNVFWTNDGRPVFIDADNALNWSRMHLASLPGHKSQSGFKAYGLAQTKLGYEHLGDVLTDPTKADPAKSKLLKKLVEDAPSVVAILRAAFSGKTGRAVPMVTNAWAEALQRASRLPAGQQADVDPPDRPTSRWAIANAQAALVGDGTQAPRENPGLAGETGIGTRGRFYDQAQEAQQIQIDLSTGKIPFYNYDFDSGDVTHNGVVVWHGQPLDEVMQLMLLRYGKQARLRAQASAL